MFCYLMFLKAADAFKERVIGCPEKIILAAAHTLVATISEKIKGICLPEMESGLPSFKTPHSCSKKLFFKHLLSYKNCVF